MLLDLDSQELLRLYVGRHLHAYLAESSLVRFELDAKAAARRSLDVTRIRGKLQPDIARRHADRIGTIEARERPLGRLARGVGRHGECGRVPRGVASVKIEHGRLAWSNGEQLNVLLSDVPVLLVALQSRRRMIGRSVNDDD